MDRSGINPQDLQQYLRGINWPTNKARVVRQADNNGAPRGVLQQIRNLGGSRFDGPQDVIGKLQGGG